MIISFLFEPLSYGLFQRRGLGLELEQNESGAKKGGNFLRNLGSQAQRGKCREL